MATPMARPPVATVAIAIGSNVGDRAAHLERAVSRLATVLSAIRVSTVIETEPQGVAPQPLFLNAAVVGQTTLSPADLLDALLAIERIGGRDRPHVGAPRTIDLDVILYGDHVIDTPGLQVPHPRFRERSFVLVPLAEIAPELVDPVTGLTIRELAANRQG